MKKGFTLLELLVSTVILSIGILSLASLFPAAMRSTMFTRQNTQAMEYNQQYIERLRNTDFDDSISLFRGWHGPDTIVDRNGRYEVTYLVTDDHPDIDMKMIDVYCKWINATTGSDKNHVSTMKTYRSRD